MINEMSNFADIASIMNLHEECLLKYLINPLDLFYSTKLLKLNNDLISSQKLLIKKTKLNEIINN